MKSHKIRKLFILIAIATPFILICTILLTTIFGSSVYYKEFNHYTLNKDKFERIEGDGYYKPAELTKDYQEILKSHPWDHNKQITTIPSVGEQKLLIIPVDFADKPCSSLPHGCDKTLNQIKNSFFGADSRNEFQSITSYFNEASFGKLHLKGKVSSWYHSSYKVEDIKEKEKTDKNLGKDLVKEIVKEALADYRKNNDDINQFDNDKDGFIDGVAFIYSAEYQNKGSALWAYQSSISPSSSDEKPSLKNYLWASYQYMRGEEYSKVDARTYIHETGHLLGLPDYYSQNSNQKFRPLGGMDMMDYNLGDENTFSKMALNWTRPYVITDATTITIDASYLNGDCILIPAGTWNGSALDEYLLLELYAPRGLNEHDSKTKYQYGEQVISLMNKVGVKIYHVDARLGYYMTIPSTFIGYEGGEGVKETLEEYDNIGQKYYSTIAHSNTLTISEDNLPLIYLLDKRGQKLLEEGSLATNDSLYFAGDVFDQELTFNNGTKLDYKIEILEIKGDKVTIKFSKR